MDLLPTPEQAEISTSAAGFLAKELPIVRIRELLDQPCPFDRGVWSQMAGLGWFVLGLSTEMGGVGYGMAEEALLFREVGRHLATGPLAATTLGARLAAQAGQAELAGAVARGDRVVGLARPRAEAQSAIGDRVTAELDLIDTPDADLVLVADPDGAALLDVAHLTSVAPAACLDEATRLGRGRAEDAPALAFVPATVDNLFRRGAVLTAAMLTGIAEAARDDAVGYAKNRVQFDQPIGAYQAVKHPCADMAIRAEAAASQLFFAALAIDGHRSDAAFQVSAAKVVAADAARRNVAANVQIHGGMGFTFEQDAHLYVKRSHVLEHAFGSSPFHLACVLDAGRPE